MKVRWEANYVCEVCEAEYNNSDDARECEVAHIDCSEYIVAHVEFNMDAMDDGYWFAGSGFPERIQIQMKDDSKSTALYEIVAIEDGGIF